jgi:hypothetical protein
VFTVKVNVEFDIYVISLIHRRRWEDNIKIDLKEVRLYLIHMADNMNRCRDLVNTIMNPCDP